MYTAIVKRLHTTAPPGYTPKEIISVLDSKPITNPQQLAFWEWMAHYYLCTEGEVMNAALPAGLKLQSETQITFNAEEAEQAMDLTEKEYAVLDVLHKHTVLGIDQLAKVTGFKNIQAIVKGLLEKGVVYIHEAIKERYSPKKETLVKLTAEYDDEDTLKVLFDKLEKRSASQLEAMMSYIMLSNRYGNKADMVRKAELVKHLPESWPKVKALEKKGVFELVEVEAGYDYNAGAAPLINTLTDWQAEALESVKTQFAKKDVVLLQGITSSGKTELYVKLITDTIAAGKQVLFLMPEIALTTQIISRLKKVFGTHIGVYHSRFNETERVEVWNRTLSYDGTPGSGFEILLGARSALFMPFTNLGLVIVDEEHETSFKQYEPAPRYHARDAAIYLASLFKAKTLLGSATPSFESYFNAHNGKYGLAIMNQRYADMPLPTVEVLNTKEARKKKQMHSIFAKPLLEGMAGALAKNEQVILFQNRRGYAPFVECNNCNWVPHCINCDVSLTYHKTLGLLKCHYCGYSSPPPAQCTACGTSNLRLQGFGTEKIEDELKIFFPTARITRMDLDTTRGKHGHRQIIEAFENGDIDILVGTQMVTKGLDFDNVSLVGILNADSMLNYPDFRAFERGYHLMVQVSGRAGRKNKIGKVVIQTADPEQFVIQSILNGKHEAFYQQELQSRHSFHYPPYYKLVEFSVKHKNQELLERAAEHFAMLLRKGFGNRILGPEYGVIKRINNYYIKKILLKTEREAPTMKVRDLIEECIQAFLAHTDYKYVQIICDADPV